MTKKTQNKIEVLVDSNNEVNIGKRIVIQNKTIDGKYWQWLVFALFNINDFFRRPICFIIGDNCNIKNFTFYYNKIKKDSTIYDFAMMCLNEQEKKDLDKYCKNV